MCRFVGRAKSIKTNAKVNELLDDGAKMIRLEKELRAAKRKLKSMGSAASAAAAGTDGDAAAATVRFFIFLVYVLYMTEYFTNIMIFMNIILHAET